MLKRLDRTADEKYTYIMKKTLGLLIKSQRISNQWKVYELAKKVAVTPEFITQIEKGRRYPSQAVLTKLSEILQVDLQPIYLNERHPDIVGYLKNGNLMVMEAKENFKKSSKANK